MAGIKETTEVVTLLKKLALAIESAKKDGKVDIFDMISLIQLAPFVMDAMNDSDQIKIELKDLDSKEKDFLIQEMQDAIFLFIRAFKGK